MRRHWALAVLLACATPLLLAFAWQEGLASVSDDSASYLVLAQAIAGVNPAVLPWVGYHTHFPPLFPLALALTGGASDFRYAHALVALLLAADVALVYAFAWRQTRSRGAALALAVSFLACPTIWVSDKGVLSEPLFLFTSLAAILYYQARVEPQSVPVSRWLVLGLLLAAVVLTRVVGVALVVALMLHVALRGRRKDPAAPRLTQLAAALIPAAVLVIVWVTLRPVAAQDSYQRVSRHMVQSWSDNTGVMSLVGIRTAYDGWIASFTADASVGVGALGVVSLVALLALAGLVRRLVANRLDAWYVAISLVVVVWWVFNEDNTRRLIFPLLPFLLLYAGESVAFLLRRARRPAHARFAYAAVGVLLAIAVLPSLLVFVDKARDRQVVIAGQEERYADMTEYYTTLNVAFSRRLAARQAVLLAGFDELRTRTPPGAKVMWMRPEYPALLGGRPGVPWYYDWDPLRVGQEARDQRVDYIVVAQLFKTDLAGRKGDPARPLKFATAYAPQVFALENPTSGTADFVLLRVDRAALDAWIARGGKS